MRVLGRATSIAVLAALLASCGGGGGSSAPIGGTPAPAPSPTPSPTPTATCSLTSRQQWAEAQLREWYLFPETLPASLSPAGYSSVQAFIDALTATARAQNKDRFFTYITSIAEENAYLNSGASAGFGVRLQYDPAASRVYVIEAFEGAPALAAGIDRGDEITAIGTSPSTLQDVSAIFASQGSNGIQEALGPSTAGVSRTLRVSGPAGTRTVTISKAEYSLTPVSSRYGAKILNDGARKIGYINLRTFISSANQPLSNAFADFRAQGVTDLIIDFRYNGGGLISTAELIGDLLGRNRLASEIFSITAFRPEKSSNNSTRFFQSRSDSVAPTRIAFITTGASASASELVINSMRPYLGDNVALIGANTFGKPVGQIALDRSACDDRLRVVALASRNSANFGDYYTGLAPVMSRTCSASDDYTRPLGDAQEGMIRTAIDFIAGRSCTPITGGLSAQSLSSAGRRELLVPASPNVAQRDNPGLF